MKKIFFIQIDREQKWTRVIASRVARSTQRKFELENFSPKFDAFCLAKKIGLNMKRRVKIASIKSFSSVL